MSADVNIHLPGVDQAVAAALVRDTERLCPYAKMTQGGIESVVALTQ